MSRAIHLRTPVALILLAALGAAGVAQAEESSGAPAAHWVQRKLDFTYMGFTTKYSCDGLVDNVRELLLALGARKKDLKIQPEGCTRFVGVEPFPGVRATFWVLAPVTPDDAAKGGASVVQATQWQRVDLVRNPDFKSDQGQCELLDQLKQKALPLFTSRNLDFHSSCVPHEITLGDIRFTVDVLRAAPVASPPA
ncbi:MAG TPA: hypothetical protein VK700_13370 [Steroidobacteraceae bacterium]|nr:hypothetical protein [Steroidobacteraceae bacterium]